MTDYLFYAFNSFTCLNLFLKLTLSFIHQIKCFIEVFTKQILIYLFNTKIKCNPFAIIIYKIIIKNWIVQFFSIELIFIKIKSKSIS